MENLGNTETESYDRTRKSSKGLLAALIEHHNYSVPKPTKTIPIFEVPPTAEKISICVLPIPAPKITVDAIKRLVCRHYGVTHNEIISPRCDKTIARPRQVAMYLAREFTEYGLITIGRKFGNRDHTTVLHGSRKIAALMDTDPVIAAEVKSLSAQLSA